MNVHIHPSVDNGVKKGSPTIWRELPDSVALVSPR